MAWVNQGKLFAYQRTFGSSRFGSYEERCYYTHLVQVFVWTWIFSCCCWVTSVMSDSVQPHRWQPTTLLCPWDFPGKSTGVGCHCLLWDFQLLWLNNKEWDCWIVVTFSFVRNYQTVPFCTSTISEWSSCCSTALVFLLIPDIMHCSQPMDGYAPTRWLGTWRCCFRSRVSEHLKEESPSSGPRGFGALWKVDATRQSSVSPGSGQGTRPSSSLPAFSCFLNFIYLSVAVLGLRCCTQTLSTCSEWWLLPHCGASASLCGSVSCCGVWTRRRGDFGSCGTWAQLLLGVWDLLRPGIEPLCPALAGGFLITGPPGTSSPYIFTGINPFPHYYSWRRLGSIDC